MEVHYFEFEGGRSPVEDFIDGLGSKQQSKAFAYMGMLKRAGNTLRMPYSRSLTRGLFELRPATDGVETRLLYFFHEGDAVIVHGFVKKTQRTPPGELAVALARKRAYLDERKGP